MFNKKLQLKLTHRLDVEETGDGSFSIIYDDYIKPYFEIKTVKKLKKN